MGSSTDPLGRRGEVIVLQYEIATSLRSLRHALFPCSILNFSMSLRYASLFDSTVRTEYERALDLAKTRIGTTTGTGRTLLPIASVTSGDWRATPTIKSRLAGGYCLRAPAQEACPYANICEHCPSFRTENSNLPVLQAQRKDAALLAQDARGRGWDSEARRHEALVAQLDLLIGEAGTV